MTPSQFWLAVEHSVKMIASKELTCCKLADFAPEPIRGHPVVTADSDTLRNLCLFLSKLQNQKGELNWPNVPRLPSFIMAILQKSFLFYLTAPISTWLTIIHFENIKQTVAIRNQSHGNIPFPTLICLLSLQSTFITLPKHLNTMAT